MAVSTGGEVTIWDTRRKESVRSLIVESGVVNKRLEVTAVSGCGIPTLVTFTGHKNAVTILNWGRAGW